MEEPDVETEQDIVILTDTLRIEGTLGIFSGVRLTDYMNESKPFIPITDAISRVDSCSRCRSTRTSWSRGGSAFRAVGKTHQQKHQITFQCFIQIPVTG